MLSYELDKNLEEIAGSGTLQEIIFRTIKTAEAEEWIEDLIRAACRTNPENPKLQAIAQILASPPQELCNIPYPRKPLFTRRKTVLPEMRNVLLARKLTSLSRLGDIGAMLVFSVLVTGLVMGVRWLGIPQVEQLELMFFDQLMRSRPSEAPDSRLLIVKITDQDLSKYGRYPLEDSIVAQLIRRLEQYNPRVIGLDIHRNKPRGKGRQELISLFQKNKNLFAVCSFGISNNNSDYAPPQELTEEQKINQLGFSDVFPDQNTNFIRRQLLSYEPSFFPSPCKTPYSFSFQLAFQFLSFEGIKPLELNHNYEWQFGKVLLKPMGNRTGAYQNLGESDQILINYRSDELAQFVTLEKVLEGKIDNSLVKGRVVLIGYADSMSKDWFDTPYGKQPGVYIHGHMVSQIISAVMDQRPLLAILPHWKGVQWGDGICVFICSFAGGLLALLLRKLLHLVFAICIASLILYQICLIIFIQGYWLPFLPLIVSLLVTGFCAQKVTKKTFEPKT
ncbi:hypothetical protein NUACC21_74750 [Scytonema sp. NUACC21]